MDIKDSLAVRRKIKSRKPKFVRQDSHKKSGLRKKWRRPRGLHSKMRLKFRGKPRPTSQGYRSPVKARGLDKSGLEARMVRNQADLEGLDQNKHGAIFSSTLGSKKRLSILKKILETKIKILNIRDPSECARKIEGEIEKKRQKRNEKRSITKEKAKKSEKLADKISEEEKKKAEKKEKDKLLTKRKS
jgi:large subunit ribosomal protein L32e